MLNSGRCLAASCIPTISYGVANIAGSALKPIPFMRIASTVQVKLVDGIRWVNIVVLVAAFDGVGFEEAAEGGHVTAGSHFDQRCHAGFMVQAFGVLTDPAVIEVPDMIVDTPATVAP